MTTQHLRDASGKVIGVLDINESTGRQTLRSAGGRVLGTYEDGCTRKANGAVYGQGNILCALLNETNN